MVSHTRELEEQIECLEAKVVRLQQGLQEEEEEEGSQSVGLTD